MTNRPLGDRIITWVGDYILPWVLIVLLAALVALVLGGAALLAFGPEMPPPVREYTLRDGTRCVSINGRGISCEWERK